MKYNRPAWDPSADLVVRGTLLFAGRQYEHGDRFEVTPQLARKAERLYRKASLVRRSELEGFEDRSGAPIAVDPDPKPAAVAHRRKRRARRAA